MCVCLCVSVHVYACVFMYACVMRGREGGVTSVMTVVFSLCASVHASVDNKNLHFLFMYQYLSLLLVLDSKYGCYRIKLIKMREYHLLLMYMMYQCVLVTAEAV